MTTQGSKRPPESGISLLPQGSSPWQRRDEALDAKESSSVVEAAPLVSSPASSLLSSPSALSNRKSKPVAPQWPPMSMSGGENQTVASGNWTNPLEPLVDEYSSGSEPFAYDLTEGGGAFSLYELDAAYSLDEPATVPPALIGPDAKNQQSFNRSALNGAFLPVTHPFTASQEGSEALNQTHFDGDSDTPASSSAAGSERPLTRSQGRLMSETFTFISNSQIPTATVSQTLTVTQTHHRAPHNASSAGHKPEETLSTQAATQHLETSTLEPSPSLLISPLSSLLFTQPTPSLSMVQLSPSAFLTEEIFPKQIFSSSLPQKEEMAQISYASLSLNRLESVNETNITGSSVDLAVTRSKQIIDLYTSTDMSPISSPSPVYPQTPSSNIFAFPLDIPHYSSYTHLPLTPHSPSLPFLSASTPFSSTHAIAPSASPAVSPVTVTLQIPTSPPLYSSNTHSPLSSSPPLWPATTPLPLSTDPQWPSLFLPSSSQQAEQRLSEAAAVVESAHVPASGGVSGNFQPSVLSSLSLSSNLQRDFVVTSVDTASLLSLPLFSKAPTESQMPVVDDALLPEYHLLSTEEPFNNTSEPFRSQLPYPEGDQLLGTQSGILNHSVGIFLDSSFSQIEPTPSGLPVAHLASSTEALASDLLQTQPALSQLLDPVFGSSVVLWPSSHAASLPVSQSLVHSHQRDLSDIYSQPDESRLVYQSAIGFASLAAAGIWASEPTPTLLQANIDKTQSLHSAFLSTISSLSSNPMLSTWSPLSHHLDNLSVAVSSETLPASTVMQVARMSDQMVGEEPALSFSSPSPKPVVEKSLLLAQTSLSGTEDRHTSSLTSNTDTWWLQETSFHLHTNNKMNTNATADAHTNSRGSQALADDVFNNPTSPLLNPPAMATTQTLAQLGTTTPQHASGLDNMHQSGVPQTNTEHPNRLIHTHSPAHTQLATQAHVSKFLDASEKLNLSQRPEQDAQNAEAHFKQQSSHSMSFAITPPPPSLSILPSLSLAATLTPTFPSLQISAAIPSYITVSPLTLSSFITPSLSPHLPGWVALPVVSANIEEAEIGSLSPSWTIAGFHQPATTQSPLDNHLQSFQRSTTYPVSQSTESIQEFITVSQPLPLDQASTPLVSGEECDVDEDLPQLANDAHTVDASRIVSGPVQSPEVSDTLTTAGKLPHLSALFDPADVVPKIHIAVEHASAAELPSSAVNSDDNVALDVVLNAPTDNEPNESLNPEAALNTQSFPVEMETASPCPTSQPCFTTRSAVSAQATGAPVIPNPLHISGLNIPSATPVSRSPTGPSIDAPGQGFISGFEKLPPPWTGNHTEHTVSNATTVITIKDSPSVPIEMTNTTKAKNATALIENGNMKAPQGNMTGSKPTSDLSVIADTSSNLTVSEPSLNSNPSASNHSGNPSSGVFVNGAVNPDKSDGDVKEAHLSPTLRAVINAHHFITTKNSSPAATFKAVTASASSGGSNSFKKATVRPTPGSPTVDLSAQPALPCQCKQRFHFTCLCGLSSGNSMSYSNKKL